LRRRRPVPPSAGSPCPVGGGPTGRTLPRHRGREASRELPRPRYLGPEDAGRSPRGRDRGCPTGRPAPRSGRGSPGRHLQRRRIRCGPAPSGADLARPSRRHLPGQWGTIPGRTVLGERIVIEITAAVFRAMEGHAREAFPEECCGFLLGRLSEPRRVEEAKRAKNVAVADRSRRYEIDPLELLHADDDARARGLDLVGIYHSHPNHPAAPSEFPFVGGSVSIHIYGGPKLKYNTVLGDQRCRTFASSSRRLSGNTRAIRTRCRSRRRAFVRPSTTSSRGTTSSDATCLPRTAASGIS